MIETLIFIVQIAALMACIFMLWRSRRALNGMGRATMLLCVALIIRRLDDAFHILDSMGILILSSIVVGLVFYDVLQVYKQRHLFALYWQSRQARIDEYEALREKSERHSGSWNQAYKKVK